MTMRRALAALLLSAGCLWADPASADCTGQFPTGSVCNNPSGSTGPANPTQNPIIAGNVTVNGKINSSAATTGRAGLNVAPGVAPTSPVNGDIWSTSAGFFVRVNGATVGPLIDSSGIGSFAGTSPIGVTFPAGVITYAFDFTVANSFLATQTFRTILAGTTNTYDVGTSATVAAFRTVYAGTSFVGPVGTFTTSVAVGGATLGGNAFAVTGTSLFNSGVTMDAALTYGGVTLSNAVTGTGNMVLSASPTFTGTITAAAVNATTLNGNTFTTGSYTLTGAAAKVLTFNNNLTLAGTDGKALTLTNGLTVSGNDGTLSFGAASKTLTINKSLTFDGTDGTTMTFPSVSSTIPRFVASGAKTLATSAITSGTCTSAQTDTATGTLTTDAITVSFNGDPTAVTGYVPVTTGMLTIIYYPTADAVNFKVCNLTASDITPGAVTINWRVVR